MPEYCTVTLSTVENHKNAIVAEVKKISVGEVPMIWFSQLDVNQELADWIKATVA
jgi:uncharacterized protein involved in tolerance to divalent cations